MPGSWTTGAALAIASLVHSCGGAPPRALKELQSEPSALSLRADRAWRSLACAASEEAERRHSALHERLLAALRALPPGSVDDLDRRDAELELGGKYGRLPEVLVDQGTGAIFPQPLPAPNENSWFEIARDAHALARDLERVEAAFGRWIALPEAERVRRHREPLGPWEAVSARLTGISRRARYVETWAPRLAAQLSAARAEGRLPRQYSLVAALQAGGALDEGVREAFRPRRVARRPFLPDRAQGLVTLPIVTDVTSRAFLSEVEGALDTHWNQSAWARGQQVWFRIEWTRVQPDRALASGKGSLEQHLERLARAYPDRAAMTTGGLTTYVHAQTLVLGPGKINPRTLAHELGHLLGFPDCYFRTLTGRGWLGTAVLEWDNPVFPDDLMCDNTLGTARAEAW